MFCFIAACRPPLEAPDSSSFYSSLEQFGTPTYKLLCLEAFYRGLSAVSQHEFKAVPTSSKLNVCVLCCVGVSHDGSGLASSFMPVCYCLDA